MATNKPLMIFEIKMALTAGKKNIVLEKGREQLLEYINDLTDSKIPAYLVIANVDINRYFNRIDTDSFRSKT